ncbi:MAG: Secreted protein [candidate division TM6 bacterium GW2011_GWF2_43_17]|nr:MAG: Secreted protein [candidate division TM6 bacterium GW2011_GWF2_43_17]HAU30414.1 hypothetical protein [Candidatus Dependentiae bacterium]
MKKYLIIPFICFTNSLVASFNPQIPGLNPLQTQMPSFEMPSQSQVPMPSADDFAALNQYLEELQQNDPEQLKELERMGNELIASLSDQELEEFSSMFGVDPQELRKEAESFLTQEKDIAPQEQPEERPLEQIERKTKTKPEEQSKKEQKATAKDAQAAQNILRSMIETLNDLRAKSTASQAIQTHLRTWDDDLVLLTFYLNLLDNKEHAQRLPVHEDGKIINTLFKLHEKIQPTIKLIDPAIEKKIPNEFAFFNFSKAPTTDELAAAYEKKRAEHDPSKIEAKLTIEGRSPRVIKQEIKIARIAQAAIDDEYERLSDPKNIAEIKRKEEKAKKEIQDATKNRNALLANVTKELGNALFEDRLLSKLEEYLKAYEPEQLKRKQAQEKAIKAQEQEQAKRSKKAPEKTASSKMEPTISYGRIPRPRSGGRGSAYSGGRTSSGGAPSSSYSDYQTPPKTSSSGSGGGGNSYSGGSSKSSGNEGGAEAGQSGIRSTPTSLADTARAESEKFVKKDLKSSMQEFTQNYDKLSSLLTNATANLTDATPANERANKLKAFTQQEQFPDLLTASDRLIRETERLVALVKKDKKLEPEFKKFFPNLRSIESKIKLFTAEDKTKNNAIIKKIDKNFKKLKELLQPYQTRAEEA